LRAKKRSAKRADRVPRVSNAAWRGRHESEVGGRSRPQREGCRDALRRIQGDVAITDARACAGPSREMIARLRRGFQNHAGARAQEGIARCLAEDSLLPVRGDHRSESIDMNGQHSRIWNISALKTGY